MDPAREAVLRRVARQVRRFPDLELGSIDTDGLDARDAAFAHAIYDAVLRRWQTLRYLLEQSIQRPWSELEPRLRAALLVGAAQIVLLDRTPVHAAVDSSVEWAKRAIRPGAGAMVNAILRRTADMIARDEEGRPVVREQWTDRADEIPLAGGGAMALSDAYLPPDPVLRLAIVTSHPRDLIRAWMRNTSKAEATRLALHGIAHPPTLLNTAHADESRPLPAHLLGAHESPGHHVWLGSHAELSALLASRRDVWAQDPSSSAAVLSVADLKPRVVLDVCAGLGTKTRQLLAVFPGAEVVATDISDERRVQMVRTLGGEPRLRIVPPKALGEWREKADLVLVDAPCTNTGVLARRVEARYRYDAERLASLASMQKQILADTVPLLRPAEGGASRGRILYATCSLDPEENDRQAAWADRWHSLRPSRAALRLPRGGPGQPAERWADGAWSALLG